MLVKSVSYILLPAFILLNPAQESIAENTFKKVGEAQQSPTAGSRSNRLNHFLSLPPALSAMAGNPLVYFSSLKTGEVTFVTGVKGIGGTGKLRTRPDAIKFIRVPGIYKGREQELPALLADGLLGHIWRVYFSNRDNRLEGIPLNRSKFRQIGLAMILADGAGLSTLERAWWKVRTGLPTEPQNNYHLLSMVGTYAEGFALYGHYAMGLRKVGGDPEGDISIDPRAPWESDLPPTAADWKNPDNLLVSGLHVRHLYDWLYTQTHLRGLEVEIDFISISKEQLMLFQALHSRPGITRIAPFRTFRYNCATMAELIYEGLLPINQAVAMPHLLADIPDRLAKKVKKRFPIRSSVTLEHHPDPTGKPRSASWKIHPAPNRSRTAEFLSLKAVPELN